MGGRLVHRGLGVWVHKRTSGKTYGERLADKHEKDSKGMSYADFASMHAWKSGSEAAHDEAMKAHESAWSSSPEGSEKAKYHSDRQDEHVDALEKIYKGEKPKKPESKGTGDFDESKVVRDGEGRFAPK